MKEGIVLFAHGSREPDWARPFRKILRSVRRRRAGALVTLAYLERMRPTLFEAIERLAARGARSIRVVPLFLGAGNHIKQDLPKLAYRGGKVRVRVERPIGEQPAVVEAIAAAIARKPR